jgi:uncharacterized glyoxalase superfamily protein PhnB
MSNWKPDHYNSVSVYIMVDGARRLIDFLKHTFDAAPLRHFDSPDGKIKHAELRIGDSVVMLADSVEGYSPFPVWLHVYVPDVDAIYKKALAAGAASVQEPSQRPGDPDRRGGFKDPAGNTWWVSTQQS